MDKHDNTAINIERLVWYGICHELITNTDAFVVRNTLLDMFNLAKPCTNEEIVSVMKEPCDDTPTSILNDLLNNAQQKQLFDGEVDTLRVNFEARIMGTLMPRQSEVSTKFNHLLSTQGAVAATKWFYGICIKSNYIRTAQIHKNIKWDYLGNYGKLEITINLTKPEKDPKTIALERLAPASDYPKCMLCIENIGYAGRINFPARQTHRVVPFTLCNEQWYMQYSPYVYYNEHCIVFSHKHEDMSVNYRSFEQIFDFVDIFPHYTCGSNADLPIVGGSILSHSHFQGGYYSFPMQSAKTICTYTHKSYPSITINNIKWPMSSLRVKGKDKQQILAFANDVLSAWRQYTDEDAGIVAYTQNGDIKTLHNTITPILHKKNEEYIFDLVPRNNRTSEQYPDGIFHPHKEIHHIKKENIGLIEVMGLAILPARLKNQCADIAQVLEGVQSAHSVKESAPEHAEWIDYLQQKYTEKLSAEHAMDTVKKEVGVKFETCLEHAGVFKQTSEGMRAYDKFMKLLGCEKL